MVPWGTGDPISSGDLNTLVFLTEKPPPLSVSIGGGSMSQQPASLKYSATPIADDISAFSHDFLRIFLDSFTTDQSSIDDRSSVILTVSF